VNANERDEITASVAAHADLGPGYETAVAEGLVERIGEEIDRRIDTRLGGQWPGQQASGYRGPMSPTPVRAAAAPPPPVPATRSNGVTGLILGLGSMGLGVGATAVVVSHQLNGAAEVIMVLLIWLMIMIINVAHSQRR
jgi:hypothetical protein